MVSGLINANPTVYEKKERRARTGPGPGDVDEYAVEVIDQLEIFDILLLCLHLCATTCVNCLFSFVFWAIPFLSRRT